ncbi:hypothetical protein GQ457_06G011990 [Hibiscus cannabinus]
MPKAPFSGKGERSSDLLGLVHSDVCGPMNTQARGGFQYFITLTDEFSQYGYIHHIRHKFEALEKFKEFKNEVQNQHGKSIKAFRSDRRGEYLSQDFDELLKECGIVSQLTLPGTPHFHTALCSIYGLKQASRSWNLRFNNAIKEFGFNRNEDEPLYTRSLENPGEGHWTTVKNILKYLRRTKDVFIVYGGEENIGIKGYTDASFQTNKDDSRSQSGFVLYIKGGVVSWKSSKQDTIVDSTIEAEYITASEAAKDSVWIKKFISELGVVRSILDAIELYFDNNGVIAQAKEPRSHQRSKPFLDASYCVRDVL